MAFAACELLAEEVSSADPQVETENYDQLNYDALEFMLAEDWSQAFKTLNQAIQVDSERSDAYLNYARAHYLRQEYHAAERAVVKTLEIDPEMAPAWYQHAQLMAIKGEPIRAYESVQKAIAIGGQLKWMYLVFLGELYADAEKRERAEEAFDEAILLLKKLHTEVEKTINAVAQIKVYEGSTTETHINYNRRTGDLTTVERPRPEVRFFGAPPAWTEELNALKEIIDGVKARKAELADLKGSG